MATITPRSAKGAYGADIVVVDVDTIDVQNMLHLAMMAVDTPSMMTFMNTKVDDYLGNRAADRFAVEGDDASGNWAPLTETTRRIKEALGAPADEINIRTGDLAAWVIETSDVESNGLGVTLTKPSQEIFSDPVATTKLQHAQQGTDSNPLFPGAVTPPRPVVALAERDMATIVQMLQAWIMAEVTMGVQTMVAV